MGGREGGAGWWRTTLSRKSTGTVRAPAGLCAATLPGCGESVGVETEEELGNERRRDGEEGKKKEQKTTSTSHNDPVWELPAFLTSRP